MIKKKKSRMLLVVFAWISLFAMIAVIVAFIMNIGEQYSADRSSFGTFLTSVFAALFSGLNVLAFYYLTLALDTQNSEREEAALHIEALKYQLENQKTLFNKVSDIHSAIVRLRFAEINKVKEMYELDNLENTVKDELSTIQLLYNCDTLFPSLDKNNLQEILDIYTQALKVQQKASIQFQLDLADGFDDGDVERYKSALAKFWERQTIKLLAYLTLMIAQMQYDIQSTLAQSLGQKAPEKPTWENEVGAITNLKLVPLLLDASRTPSFDPPEPSIYRWDLTYLNVNPDLM